MSSRYNLMHAQLVAGLLADSAGDGARLLNVAASRARDHLVVVAALDQLHRSRTTQDAVWQFFAKLFERGQVVSWETALDDSSATHRVTGPVTERLRDDFAGAGTVEMWLPRAPLVGLRSLIPSLKLLAEQDVANEPVTIWVEPDPDGYLSAEATEAKRGGVNIRPCLPILESSAIIDDVVWTSTGSLLGPDPGIVLRTRHAAFADAVRRAQRRRPGLAPGSGQLGDDCGRCSRTLVRFEVGRRGLPTVGYGCMYCDSAKRRQSREVSERHLSWGRP